MHVEDKSKAFRQVLRKDQLAKLEEVRKAPEHWQPQNFNGRRKLANPVRRNLELRSKFKVGVRLNVGVKLKSKSSINISSAHFHTHGITFNFFADGKRMKITAVHYEGDSSSLAASRHHDYQGEEGRIIKRSK